MGQFESEWTKMLRDQNAYSQHLSFVIHHRDDAFLQSCTPLNIANIANNRLFSALFTLGILLHVTISPSAPVWYRLDHPTGNQLPTHVVSPNRCGTQVPIWMDGDHPRGNPCPCGFVYASGNSRNKAVYKSGEDAAYLNC